MSFKNKYFQIYSVIAVSPLIMYFLSNVLNLNAFLGYSILSVILTVAFVAFHKKIIAPLNQINEVMDRMKDGDFSYENNDNSSELNLKIVLVAKTVRDLVSHLETNVKTLYKAGSVLQSISSSSAHIANEVALTVEQLANGASEQVNDINQCTQNIVEITNTSNDINSQVKKIASIADEFVNIAVQGKKDIESTLDKVMQIKNSSESTAVQITYLGKIGTEIGEIVDLITGISGQINLLALNAAIEAARAGEHGRGFAVVADEVKKLAIKSAEAANQIKDMVGKVQSESSKAVISTNKSLVKVDEGVNAFEVIRNNFEKIYEQSKIIDKESNAINNSISTLVDMNNAMNDSMTAVSHVTEGNAAAAQEIAASTQEHSAGTQELNMHASDILKLSRNITVSSSVFKIDSKPIIFYWSKKFFTGIEEIDYEHYKIVNYVNELYQKVLTNASSSELATILMELAEFTTNHFKHEEELMLKHKYPKIKEHFPKHAKLLNDIGQFVKKLQANDAKIDNSLITFLTDWLENHILKEDMQYAPYLKD
jgi:methyl-accepting chemotaxis protein